MRCTRHSTINCLHSECRRERERRASVEDAAAGGLTDPTSALHQATYGGTYYGSSSNSSSSCGSSDSGSSGSSSSSYDSGPSSSSDCGSY